MQGTPTETGDTFGPASVFRECDLTRSVARCASVPLALGCHEYGGGQDGRAPREVVCRAAFADRTIFEQLPKAIQTALTRYLPWSGLNRRAIGPAR